MTQTCDRRPREAMQDRYNMDGYRLRGHVDRAGLGTTDHDCAAPRRT
jgi:hypothetical protein